jgi:hypothetical protein
MLSAAETDRKPSLSHKGEIVYWRISCRKAEIRDRIGGLHGSGHNTNLGMVGSWRFPRLRHDHVVDLALTIQTARRIAERSPAGFRQTPKKVGFVGWKVLYFEDFSLGELGMGGSRRHCMSVHS